ncbi:hypothetical protein LOK49_LG02G03573 [Camellia lanceoleosa]|uniref:Uncharacterized protein n=1 Tax=Camellia lanceoleosa TaxID=1840588 RepID=A0ACC0ILT8_9ERIC|nr:hypothetical protein LOK49_LG02G03573 [Camellia lanceoleosa]
MKNKKKKNDSSSSNDDRENYRTTSLSTVVLDYVKRWFQKAKGDDFSSEFVGGIVNAINVGYIELAWLPGSEGNAGTGR